jgi:aminoglycoside phosphotransferase (APT) family kinase protein
VVKLLHPTTPRQWATLEADIIRRVHAAGLPVPATDGVIEVEGRTGIVLERIEGESMWERMKSRPGDVHSLIDVLVDLQVQVQHTAVDGLPDLVRRLGSKVGEAASLSAQDRQRAQRMLEELPAGNALCHGDFHPANIVLTGQGRIVLDWYDAAVGDPAADFARSSLLMRPLEAKNTWLRGATSQLLELVHCTYVTELAGRRLIDAATFAPWEAVVAVARMSEPVPTNGLVEIWELWRSEGPAAAGSMFERCRMLVDRQGEDH